MAHREDYVASYLERLSAFLGHHYWIFHVTDELCSDGWAEVHIEDHNEAEVKLSARFWRAAPSLKTQILLHELLHISFTRQHEHLEDCIAALMDFLPKSHKKHAKSQMIIHLKAAERAEEVEVNRLAVLLSRFAPPWDME